MSLPNEVMPLGLLGAGAEAEEQYQIEHSLRFNSADSAYLSRTPASAGNRKTWTWAGWVKRSTLTTASRQMIFTGHNSFNAFIGFATDDKFEVSTSNGSSTNYLATSAAVFRDTSAWAHIVVAVDTTQATESNRARLWVNNVQQTLSGTIIPQNGDTSINLASAHRIGSNTNNSLYFAGYLADIHLIDGQALDPTSFGKFDTNGVWQPKAYAGSYGTNGFHLPFSDNSTAAALGTDTSGNGNDWTVNNITGAVPFYYSTLFDGSGDSASVADNTALQLGTGDFTIEFWIRFNALSGYQTVFDKGYVGAGGMTLQTTLNTGNFAVYLDGATLFNTTGTVVTNTWYHFALVRSGTTVTAYRNGTSVGSGTSSSNFNNTSTLYFGGSPGGGGYYLNGYLSNLRIVKGTAVYTSTFTPPTTPLTAIANTSLLTAQSSTFIDNSANAFTVTANGDALISLLNPFSSADPKDTDSFVDSPTNYGEDTGAGSEVRGNYATLNPLDTTATLSNGSLDVTRSAVGAHLGTRATFGIASGKWYWEATYSAGGVEGSSAIGVALRTWTETTYCGDTNSWSYHSNGNKYLSGPGSSYGATYTTGDIIGIAFDADAGTITAYKNGASQGQLTSGLTSGPYFPAASVFNASAWNFNFGQRPFAYTAPSGFKALCTTNLPTPDPAITPGSKVMDVALYTGNGGTQTISGLGFSPDFVWIKNRSHGRDNNVYDAVRGATKLLSTNSTPFDVYDGTGSEQTVSGLTAFNSDGFSVGSDNVANQNTYTYVAWTWDAGSSTVTNNDGSISSQVRANASAGFSVVTFNYPSSGSFTVGHGLNATPGLIITKHRTRSVDWFVYHSSLGKDQRLSLNTIGAVVSDSNFWGSAAISSATFGGTVGASGISGDQDVAYCFAPVADYSAFGSYVGNGLADGPFVYTGFSPRWILIKSTSTTGWAILDAARNTYNLANSQLFPHASNAEITSPDYFTADFLSNGFKLRTTSSASNTNAQAYIYAAFAEHPFSISRAR